MLAPQWHAFSRHSVDEATEDAASLQRVGNHHTDTTGLYVQESGDDIILVTTERSTFGWTGNHQACHRHAWSTS